MAGGNFGGGDGSVNNPWLVEDADDLNAIRNNPNTHYYLQVADIDLGVAPYNLGWQPLPEFKGVYDGAKYKIKNFYGELGGLWSQCGNMPTLHTLGNFRNIILTNLMINAPGLSGIGGIVNKYQTATIIMGSGVRMIGCHVQGTIIAASSVGGLAGAAANYASSTYLPVWDYCSADVIINASGNAVGGIVGQIQRQLNTNSGSVYDQITNCYTKGSISGGSYVGGLAGLIQAGYSGTSGVRAYHYIEKNHSEAALAGVSHVGGIVGLININAKSYPYGYIRNCVALMNSITRTTGVATTFGRVWGHIATPQYMTLGPNYALDTMEFVAT